MASNSTLPKPNQSTNGDDSSNNKANVQRQQKQLEEKRGKSWERNHRRKKKKRELRLKTVTDQATTTNGTLTPSVSSLETQPRSPCSPSTIRSTNVDRLSEVQKALEGVDKSFFGGSSGGETKDIRIGEIASGSGDSPTCAEVNAMGGGPWPADSKRRRGSMPDDASKKAKFSTLSEGVGLETNSAHPSMPMANLASQVPSTSVNLASQAPIWTPEFFVGGNPRTGPLRADQSAFADEVAVGLAYGSRLPADKAYFAQCKDVWEIYTHAAKCLAGVIGATTELHNRATMLRPSSVETDSRVSRLEVQLASKNSELEEASKKIKKQAEKIANQARHIEGLISGHQHLKKNLAENDEQCKMVSQQYVDECQRYQALCNQYGQLQHEKKEQEDFHTNEVARLAQEKLLAVQSSGKRILHILGVSFKTYQTKCKAMPQTNENQFKLEGEFVPLTPFLESECVDTDIVRNTEEDEGSKGGVCSRKVSDKANGLDV